MSGLVSGSDRPLIVTPEIVRVEWPRWDPRLRVSIGDTAIFIAVAGRFYRKASAEKWRWDTEMRLVDLALAAGQSVHREPASKREGSAS